ncbi:hypothetical protein B5807_09789 [Epicoccum nigrum]|uniref:Uncharacterized protein n=1 Tax=Epicoccum nigrum TaxID=105696 RepID=A0A1Y2LTL7_EPING|nr:hypothetical protein B5807_09789 [Epicoccum nigrum]
MKRCVRPARAGCAARVCATRPRSGALTVQKRRNVVGERTRRPSWPSRGVMPTPAATKGVRRRCASTLLLLCFFSSSPVAAAAAAAVSPLLSDPVAPPCSILNPPPTPSSGIASPDRPLCVNRNPVAFPTRRTVTSNASSLFPLSLFLFLSLSSSSSPYRGIDEMVKVLTKSSFRLRGSSSRMWLYPSSRASRNDSAAHWPGAYATPPSTEKVKRATSGARTVFRTSRAVCAAAAVGEGALTVASVASGRTRGLYGERPLSRSVPRKGSPCWTSRVWASVTLTARLVPGRSCAAAPPMSISASPVV